MATSYDLKEGTTGKKENRQKQEPPKRTCYSCISPLALGTAKCIVPSHLQLKAKPQPTHHPTMMTHGEDEPQLEIVFRALPRLVRCTSVLFSETPTPHRKAGRVQLSRLAFLVHGKLKQAYRSTYRRHGASSCRAHVQVQ